MKKHWTIVLAAAMLLSLPLLNSCGKTENTETDKQSDTESQTESQVETEPKEAETPAATELAETEPPKRDAHVYIDLTSDDSNRSPLSLMSNQASIAAHIRVTEGFLEEASIDCPSWSDSIGSLTMKIYTWDTDYDTTIAGEPVFTLVFEDYDDNATLTANLATDETRGLPAGEYLWWLGDGVDASGSGVGVWTGAKPEEQENLVELFRNGKPNTSSGYDGSLTIVIPAE